METSEACFIAYAFSEFLSKCFRQFIAVWTCFLYKTVKTALLEESGGDAEVIRHKTAISQRGILR